MIVFISEDALFNSRVTETGTPFSFGTSYYQRTIFKYSSLVRRPHGPQQRYGIIGWRTSRL